MIAIHQHFRLDNRDDPGGLAQRRIARKRMGIDVDRCHRGNVAVDVDHRSPFREPRTALVIFFQALGDVYSIMGKSADATPWYERARDAYLKSVEQGNAHYYHHLAGFYSDAQENPAEALRWARKDLEVRHSVYAFDSLAWALYKNGEFARAAEEMTRALTLGTKDAHLLFHGGMILGT